MTPVLENYVRHWRFDGLRPKACRLFRAVAAVALVQMLACDAVAGLCILMLQCGRCGNTSAKIRIGSILELFSPARITRPDIASMAARGGP